MSFYMIRPPPLSDLFPYTTLFRSVRQPVPVQLRRVRQRGGFVPRVLRAPRLHRSQLHRVPVPGGRAGDLLGSADPTQDRKSTRLNSSHITISYAVFCLKKKNTTQYMPTPSGQCIPLSYLMVIQVACVLWWA